MKPGVGFELESVCHVLVQTPDQLTASKAELHRLVKPTVGRAFRGYLPQGGCDLGVNIHDPVGERNAPDAGDERGGEDEARWVGQAENHVRSRSKTACDEESPMCPAFTHPPLEAARARALSVTAPCGSAEDLPTTRLKSSAQLGQQPGRGGWIRGGELVEEKDAHELADASIFYSTP